MPVPRVQRFILHFPNLTDNCHIQLHSYFLVSDGIIDQVEINHGKLSWHQVDGVGSNAFNDALLLEGAVYQLAREHFRREPYYVDLLELLHETRHPAYFRNPVPVSPSKLRFIFLHKLIVELPVCLSNAGNNSTLTNFPLISEFSRSSNIDFVRRSDSAAAPPTH